MKPDRSRPLAWGASIDAAGIVHKYWSVAAWPRRWHRLCEGLGIERGSETFVSPNNPTTCLWCISVESTP